MRQENSIIELKHSKDLYKINPDHIFKFLSILFSGVDIKVGNLLIRKIDNDKFEIIKYNEDEH